MPFINRIAKEKLKIVQSERVASAGGRKGGLGGIPPALQILGEISSNFFERTPPKRIVELFKGIRVIEREGKSWQAPKGCQIGPLKTPLPLPLPPPFDSLCSLMVYDRRVNESNAPNEVEGQ